MIRLTGVVTPDPGDGTVRIWVAFKNNAARWVTATLQDGGTFLAQLQAPSGSTELNTLAVFEGNKLWSESRSPVLTRKPPNPVN